MRKVFNFIRELIIYSIAWFFGGFVGGIATLFTVLFAVYGFIFAFIVLLVFLPFHYVDLKRFYLNKNWFAFIGRIIIVYLIGAFIGGFIAYRTGLMELPTNAISAWIFFVGTVISWIVFGFFLILIHFFSESNAMKKIQEISRGLNRIGVLWF